MKLNGAQAVWESLVREGVDTVFGISGGAVINLYHEMPNYPIRHVLMRPPTRPTVTPALPAKWEFVLPLLGRGLLIWSPGWPPLLWTSCQWSPSPGRWPLR